MSKYVANISTNAISIFFISIMYFLVIRLVSTITYKVFPKYDEGKSKERRKNILLLEALSELGLIAVIVYLLRTSLIELMTTFNIVYSNNYEYEKYVIFVLNPALFSGPSDLKKKLDFVFSNN